MFLREKTSICNDLIHSNVYMINLKNLEVPALLFPEGMKTARNTKDGRYALPDALQNVLCLGFLLSKLFGSCV